MPPLADLPLPAIVSAISAFLMALIGLITWIAKAIFEYLIARIKTLEGREQTTMTSVVETIETTSDSIKIIADFTSQLVDDLKYRERRRREDAEGGRQ